MKLYEFEGKSLFQKAGIQTPKGEVAASIGEAKAIARDIGYPVVLKSQVLRGGRGKAGGIQFSDTETELIDTTERMFGTKLGEEIVEKLLIEQKIDSDRELYAGITQDPETLYPVLMVSVQGGVDIESIAETDPTRIFKQILDPTLTYRLFHMMDLISPMEFESTVSVKIAKILLGLINCYFKFEAVTAEINPMMLTDAGVVYAADAKFEIDDSALYRIKESKSFHRPEAFEDPLEAEAKAAGVAYVPMGEGNIGIISGGAGLAMASMDLVSILGGKPANFLDLGGGTTPERTAAALKLVLKTPGVEGVLFNVFGGINNCEQMAKGIAQVFDEKKPTQTIIVKMRGYSQEVGWEILEARNINIVKHGTSEDAVKLLLAEMKKREVV